MVVESYHSLEDRLVKQAFAAATRSDVPTDLPFVPEGSEPALRLVTRGAEKAEPAEIEENPRAASVRLRAVERVRDDRGAACMSSPALQLRSRDAADRRGGRRAGPAHGRARGGGPRAARVPFVTLVSLVLLGGVVGLLLFNTSMQQASFATTALEEQATTLSAREQTLQMELDVLRDPQRVAERAQTHGHGAAVRHPAFLQPRRPARCSASRAPATGRRALRLAAAAAGQAGRSSTRRPDRPPGRSATGAAPPAATADGTRRRRRHAATATATPSAETGDPVRPARPLRDRRSRRPRRPRGSLRGSPLFRLRFGFVVIAMVLSVFGARLVQLQGVDPKAYAEMAAAEGMVEVDAAGRRAATSSTATASRWPSSVDGLMVVADPLLTADQAPELAKFLANRLDVDYFTILPRLREEGSRFEYIARRVPVDRRDRGASRRRRRPASRASTPGATRCATTRPATSPPTWSASSAPTRPLGGLRAHLRRAARRHRRLGALRGRRRQPDPARREHRRRARRRRTTCSTTIDRDLQWYAQRVLRQTVEDARADSGFAVVMDTETGEILALADYPTFDASDPLRRRKEDLGSRAMSDVYEPGSVEKVLTLSALIDAGKVTPRTRIVVPPELRRDGRVIDDWFPHGQIRLTLAGVLAKSSNIGTVRAADEFAPRRAAPLPRRGSGSASAPTSASAARRRASCPTPACGPA